MPVPPLPPVCSVSPKRSCTSALPAPDLSCSATRKPPSWVLSLPKYSPDHVLRYTTPLGATTRWRECPTPSAKTEAQNPAGTFSPESSFGQPSGTRPAAVDRSGPDAAHKPKTAIAISTNAGKATALTRDSRITPPKFADLIRKNSPKYTTPIISICRGSPNHIETFVELERAVRSDDRNLFGQRLRDDLTVKGVRVMRGKIVESEGMLCAIRQYLQLKIGNALRHVPLSERELPSRLFDGDFRKGNHADFAHGAAPGKSRHCFSRNAFGRRDRPKERARIQQHPHF